MRIFIILITIFYACCESYASDYYLIIDGSGPGLNKIEFRSQRLPNSHIITKEQASEHPEALFIITEFDEFGEGHDVVNIDQDIKAQKDAEKQALKDQADLDQADKKAKKDFLKALKKADIKNESEIKDILLKIIEQIR